MSKIDYPTCWAMLKKDLESKLLHSPSIKKHARKVSSILDTIENRTTVITGDSWDEFKTSIIKLEKTSSDFDSKLDKALLYSMIKLERLNTVSSDENIINILEHVCWSAQESEAFISRLETYILENCPVKSSLLRPRNFSLTQPPKKFRHDSNNSVDDFKLGTFYLKIPNEVNHDFLVESLSQVFMRARYREASRKDRKLEFYVPFFLVPFSTTSNDHSYIFEIEFERPRISLVSNARITDEKVW